MLNETPLSRVIHSQAERYGDRVALRYRDYELGRWCDISWNEFSRCVRQVSNALLELGVEVQEKTSAKKATIEVASPAGDPLQFFKVKFGE